MHINVQQIYISNGPYAHRFYISNNFISRELSKYRGVLHCEGDFPDKIMEAPLSEPYFTRTTKMLSRPDCFMLYSKVGIDFLPTSELLYSMMKLELRLIRALFNFLKVTDNPNLSLGILDRSLYAPRIDLGDDYHKKNNGHACIYFSGIQLLGDSGIDVYQSWQTKPGYSRTFL